MFGCLLGWSKASKFKRTVRRLQVRMKAVKNKREAMVRVLKQDVAQLIKLGCHDIAFQRVEQLVQDEDLIKVYELLDNYCDVITINLSYIRKRKDLPNDINEAVSTLVFASARCGDLPELITVRELVEDRYGYRFEKSALDLWPGNLVNRQVVERLTVRVVSDDVKLMLLDEIARENRLMNYLPRWQKQENPQSQNQIQQDSSSSSQESFSNTNSFSSSSTTTHSSHDEFEYMVTRIGTKEILTPSITTAKKPDTSEPLRDHTQSIKEEAVTTSPSESPPQLPEEMFVYLDDVEELQSDQNSPHDQRVFKFRTENFEEISDEYSDTDDQFDSSGGDKNIMYYENLPISKQKSRFDREELRGKGPYSRAMSMPEERYGRSDEKEKNISRRTVSFPDQSPNHVHPKLPDYDDLAAKFMALKKEHQSR
ncbi:IST1-like protein [Linum perenne]